mmetsp:Transcript_7330/g.10484  ORF Transcript_7330/g.10484 Transcript_7330/m.10484 type:complete len:160 (-) Transcript_7330:438-917(-)
MCLSLTRNLSPFKKRNIIKTCIISNGIRNLSVSSSSPSSSITPQVTKVNFFRNESSLGLILSSSSTEEKTEIQKPFILTPYFNSNVEEAVDLDKRSNQVDISNGVLEGIVEKIESHYALENNSKQFVGGMGENDNGVWFTTGSKDIFDTLDHWDLIKGM